MEGAEAICLGSGALVGLAEMLETEIGLPVIDGVTAAVRAAEELADGGPPLGSTFAPLPDKDRPGWPLMMR